MDIRKLRDMKAHMAQRGNWKEVERINKMIKMELGEDE